MTIVLPDPYPGRCRNYRDANRRCLDYEGHGSACRFPERKRRPIFRPPEVYTHTRVQPEPWVSPLPAKEEE